MLEQLRDRACWEKFYEYKQSLACPKEFTRELREFIDREGYIAVCDRIDRGEPFPLPRKVIISKQSSQKKRTVYIYPDEENIVLKLLTYLLLRRYDGIFCPELYSFRPGTGAKDAIRRLTRTPGLKRMYSYKADISNYFNSIDIGRFLPMLETVLAGDPELFVFLKRLLEEPEVLDGDRHVREQKGIMAGTPLSAFYANLFLNPLDRIFHEREIPYARYSDDIILFAPDREIAEIYAGNIRKYLAEQGLEINPGKEAFGEPEDGFTFLGFQVRGGEIDIAPASVTKLKRKMRRKTRALMRWATRNGLEGQRAAAAFIRIFNRKLLESSRDNDLTWSFWFFSVITTDKSLHEIDRYAQDCLRYLISGRRTKARFNTRYEDLKALGYRSLVNAYYSFGRDEAEKGAPAKAAPAAADNTPAPAAPPLD